MKNPNKITIDYDYIQKVSADSGIGTDMLFSEFDEAVDHVLTTGWFEDEIKCMIENILDDFYENHLPGYRARVIEGRRENEAYEEYRQKQLDKESN